MTHYSSMAMKSEGGSGVPSSRLPFAKREYLDMAMNFSSIPNWRNRYIICPARLMAEPVGLTKVTERKKGSKSTSACDLNQGESTLLNQFFWLHGSIIVSVPKGLTAEARSKMA